jgi:hypothetical protein
MQWYFLSSYVNLYLNLLNILILTQFLAGMCDNCASSIELKDIDATCMISLLSTPNYTFYNL